MAAGNKIYFASDFHLGIPTYEKSLEREKKLVRWLDEIKTDAQEVYLMGDLFDFWFEYGTVVPKGYVRLLGKLADLTDSGIKVTLFTGNHDMWLYDYLPKELNVTIYTSIITRQFNGKKFYLAHGDGLGPGDHRYKFLKKIFASKICQWLFARIHPNLGLTFGYWLSRKSRISTGTNDDKFLGDDKEWLVIYSKEILQKEHFDYFIYGHRHLPLDIKLSDKSRYINLGDWVKYFTYALWDGEQMELKTFN